MLQTILFDLDGTLVPFDQEDFIKAYFRVLTDRLTPMGYDTQALIAALWRGTGAMVKNDGSRLNRQVFWECFTQDLGVQALALESILDDFYAQEFDAVRSVLREKPDRRPLITALREKGYGVALATNPIFPRVAVETRLRWVGLRGEDFDLVTTYENSRFSKPNLDYYRAILDRLGLEAGRCMMVGNNPVEDMAALQLGLEGFLVTDCIENPDHLPIGEYRHGDFRALEAFLAALPSCNQ
jgi:HAD superfamily hydrolase (TIGR01549 family)